VRRSRASEIAAGGRAELRARDHVLQQLRADDRGRAVLRVPAVPREAGCGCRGGGVLAAPGGRQGVRPDLQGRRVSSRPFPPGPSTPYVHLPFFTVEARDPGDPA
ncbi:unnamed protein product, partial [Ectocarpus sp. 8 AP-2014]